MERKFTLLIFILTLALCSHKTESSSGKESLNINKIIEYEPEMLAPGVISKASFEGHASITPNGKEVYFAVYSNDHGFSTIAYSVKTNGKWMPPKIASFSGKYSDGSPALSPDGKKLFFSSNRPIKDSTINTNNDIWFVERISKDEWSRPIRLSDSINTSFNEFSPSVDNNGNLYFCSNRPSVYGDMDVYYSHYSNGKYQKPELLNDSINSKYHEGNVGVSPDGNQLFIMVQRKPGDFGHDDIHYSKKINGSWCKSKNIGTIVNTYTYDFSPKVSPDGKILFFSSRINRNFNAPSSIYTYDTFQDHLNSPLNGFGNIFYIEIDKLNL
ncbi:hypothetical protein MHTCC0001_12830 [Flavobacteriaceae bacterium MHTCC 0001]